MTSERIQGQRVLVVDDHDGARRWLVAAALTAFPGAQCQATDSLAEARAALSRQGFDLALVDLGLPDGSGLKLLAELRRDSPQTVCVVATIHDDDEHVFAALKLGVQGYVLKDQAQDRLADLLVAMQQGQPPLSPAIARRLLQQFSMPPPAAVQREAAALTPREREVLGFIGKGYSIPEASQALSVSAHTVQDYVKSIYRKLAICSRAEAALAAREFGLS